LTFAKSREGLESLYNRSWRRIARACCAAISWSPQHGRAYAFDSRAVKEQFVTERFSLQLSHYLCDNVKSWLTRIRFSIFVPIDRQFVEPTGEADSARFVRQRLSIKTSQVIIS
jgi:hypothetical protein